MSRILVTGGSSYLGRHLVPLVGGEHTLCYTYFQHDLLQLPTGVRLDVRDETAVHQLIAQFQPDVIIHTVGSNRPQDMANIILLGTQHVVSAATEAGARLIHLSTDSIFDGKEPPYDETAVPTPVNPYGQAKAEAEAIVSQHTDHVIVRTSLIYGLQVMDNGTGWMASALRRGESVTLFDNQVRNPVWVDSLSLACLELAQHDYVGILNVAGRQVLTRAEFGLRMLDWWQVEPRQTLNIGPSQSDKWPLNCELAVRRATAVLKTPLLGVDEVLDIHTRP